MNNYIICENDIFNSNIIIVCFLVVISNSILTI